ncbi:hypothetical protein EJ06DRAFT_998 [Trichodelitschia bisporula]|uniref:Uncharacterized protein n=1 Tax=Trichodelitschia bisporula TaxID=703511 RepID=A0A6G1I9H8_9PEZI|nr:hypothetical protein EJ06DRAFT_998 [Trichodelitschia bisporula]
MLACVFHRAQHLYGGDFGKLKEFERTVYLLCPMGTQLVVMAAVFYPKYLAWVQSGGQEVAADVDLLVTESIPMESSSVAMRTYGFRGWFDVDRGLEGTRHQGIQVKASVFILGNIEPLLEKAHIIMKIPIDRHKSIVSQLDRGFHVFIDTGSANKPVFKLMKPRLPLLIVEGKKALDDIEA